jgi:hypothetical protein
MICSVRTRPPLISAGNEITPETSVSEQSIPGISRDQADIQETAATADEEAEYQRRKLQQENRDRAHLHPGEARRYLKPPRPQSSKKWKLTYRSDPMTTKSVMVTFKKKGPNYEDEFEFANDLLITITLKAYNGELVTRTFEVKKGELWIRILEGDFVRGRDLVWMSEEVEWDKVKL